MIAKLSKTWNIDWSIRLVLLNPSLCSFLSYWVTVVTYNIHYGHDRPSFVMVSDFSETNLNLDLNAAVSDLVESRKLSGMGNTELFGLSLAPVTRTHSLLKI